MTRRGRRVAFNLHGAAARSRNAEIAYSPRMLLFARGPKIVFARVITPALTYKAYTVQDDTEGGLFVEWHGTRYAHMENITDQHETWSGIGWIVTGTNEVTGIPETWQVMQMSCGCGHSPPVETAAADLALLAG